MPFLPLIFAGFFDCAKMIFLSYDRRLILIKVVTETCETFLVSRVRERMVSANMLRLFSI